MLTLFRASESPEKRSAFRASDKRVLAGEFFASEACVRHGLLAHEPTRGQRLKR